ncbi:MAG: PPC domain-containing DNA-binding protein, partial [Leptolyngbya sp.]|nr:PPC domain-containing DNA-binding protein [Leptolyngbya sp.]
LHPGEDLRDRLQALAQTQGWEAAAIVTAVGSLTQAHLRFAGQPQGTVLTGPFEILSLVGTLSRHGLHLHISVGDANGQVWGGHLLSGCPIYTTAEIVLTTLPGWVFTRSPDPATGYRELAIAVKGYEGVLAEPARRAWV